MRNDRWIAKIMACRIMGCHRDVFKARRFKSQVSFNSCKHVICEDNIRRWRKAGIR